MEKFENCREEVDDGFCMEADLSKNQLFRTIWIYSECRDIISGEALMEPCSTCNYRQIVEEADIQSEIEMIGAYTQESEFDDE
jgi:hypothetical protein